jgi:hypothetical protein
MTKLTQTLTQSGLLAVLLEHQRSKAIELAQRRAHRAQLRATFWSTLTSPWRALMIPTLVHNSVKPLRETVPVPRSNLSPKPIAMSHQTHTYPELRQKIHDDLPLWTRDVISQRPPSFFTHVKQVAAIIVALGFLFWLWFGVSTYHPPRASYPYYDTQKPVPPWSEPTPLEGNHNR